MLGSVSAFDNELPVASRIPVSPTEGKSRKDSVRNSGSATPVPVQPGLSLPQNFPPLAAPSRGPALIASSQNPRKRPGTSPLPVIPVISTAATQTAIRQSIPSKGNGAHSAEEPTPSSLVSGNDANIAVKGLSTGIDQPSISSTEVARDTQETQVASGKDRPLPQQEENEATFAQDEQRSSGNNRRGQDSSSTSEKGKAVEKRQRPGKLDIAAAKDSTRREIEALASSSDQAKLATPNRASRKVVSTLSQPSTPATAVSQSSTSTAPRQAPPRTLRVVATPKTETPPRSSGLPLMGPAGLINKQVSRQASLSSINQPGTPVNDLASDNASATSNSLSRPGSPPPGRIGSATVRQTTKSQQKKERQARAKRMEENKQLEEPKPTDLPEEPVQAPIVGRKKKAKKTTASTPTERQPSDRFKDIPIEAESEEPNIEEPKHEEPKSEEPSSTKRQKIPRVDSKNVVRKEIVEASVSEDVAGSPAATTPDTGEKSQKTLANPAMLFAELQKAGSVAATVLDLFRNVSGINYRFDLAEADIAETTTLPSLSNAQRITLEQGHGVIVETGNNKRAVVLPDRRTLRGFSREQAQRYLDLREQTLAATGATAFHSSRHSIDRWLRSSLSSVANLEGHANETRFGGNLDASNLANEGPELINHFFPPNPLNGMSASNYWTDAIAAGAPLDEKMPVRNATMTVEEAEKAMIEARKETEALEKRLNGLIKKNRRLLVGNAH